MLHTYYHRTRSDGRYDAFRSKGYVAEYQIPGPEGDLTALQHLPAFLRTLLVTDGTVTKSLEAFYWEPVSVTGLTQRAAQAEEPIAWLDVSAGETVLARYVQLRGKHTQRVFANAFSLIRLSLLPEGLRNGLLDGSIGIGELIRSCGLESYRELLELGSTNDFSMGGAYGDASEKCVFRTYRITMNGQPTMLVTECFPIALFRT